mmetsp:Transcript_2484/g.5890  ORF Transcript_2484/g.5890 Transcript_2484/m.5890 type:complete len:223 (-) Transcript_2484:90-758(-)
MSIRRQGATRYRKQDTEGVFIQDAPPVSFKAQGSRTIAPAAAAAAAAATAARAPAFMSIALLARSIAAFISVRHWIFPDSSANSRVRTMLVISNINSRAPLMSFSLAARCCKGSLKTMPLKALVLRSPFVESIMLCNFVSCSRVICAKRFGPVRCPIASRCTMIAGSASAMRAPFSRMPAVSESMTSSLLVSSSFFGFAEAARLPPPARSSTKWSVDPFWIL